MSGPVGLLLLATFLGGCAAVGPSVVSEPPASVTPSPSSSPRAASATPRATATASPTPSAAPTPTPDPAALELVTISCEGGVVLDWSPTQHPDFHHYSALRSPSEEIAPDWPPIAPAVDWGDTYTTDRFVTSGADASIIPSDTTWFYRVVAYDARNQVLAASPVQPARLHDVADLGRLEPTVTADGAVELRWTPYEGEPECFSTYRVLSGTNGFASGLLAVVSGQDSDRLLTTSLHGGTTYELRVQAMRTTTLGTFVVGESEVLTYAVP